MRVIQALSVIIILSLIFLFKEYQEYNDLKKYKDVTSVTYKLCLSPEDHKKTYPALTGNTDNIPPSCQEEINKKFKKNIFRKLNGDELIFKY